MADSLKIHARDLESELAWFSNYLDARLDAYFGRDGKAVEFHAPEPPELNGTESYYSRFVSKHHLTSEERLVLILALVPHIRPQLLDVCWVQNQNTGRGFTEFGGWKGLHHSGFIPTGETAAFILAGDDLQKRFSLYSIFDGNHLFAKHHILSLSPVETGEPMLSGALTVSREYLNKLIMGIERKPNYNMEFPAKLIETELEWEQLILPYSTLEQLDEIRQWILHGKTLLSDWQMGQMIKPGYTSLFYGAPGTGKTFAACLLGKYCNCDVYRIDLSMIISKYIGETEKNLSRIFDMAEHKNWILFFDEADALFGKRTKVEDSHDRYANQEVSYLLQRIEDFTGVVILASNLKANIDPAFLRRFQSVIHFPLPTPAERLRIWQNAKSPVAELEKEVRLEQLADVHEITGGTILNSMRFASMKALSSGSNVILKEDLDEAIRREFQKEGKSM
ncbi:MAG: AAA family ATPase [Bacteroidales bacterium]|nr:AAA family ATPase [Bacteroidales bacterium]